MKRVPVRRIVQQQPPGPRGWRFAVAPLVLVAMAVPCLRAQTPAESVSGPTAPAPVPLSGPAAQSGGVGVTQGTTNSGGGNSVNTINSTVTVQPPYDGSVIVGKASGELLPLTLAEALKRGLRTNLGALAQEAAVQQAQGQRDVARSALLPNLNAGVVETFERENLSTLGITSKMFPEGPKFNYIDARVRLQQTVLDLVRVDNLRSASESLKASLRSTRNSRDLIVLAVGGSYLQLIATEARVVAAQAQVESSRAVAKQAADRFAAGLNARIDPTREQVQLQTEQQRLRALQADRDTQKLRLARIIGLPLGQPFVLADDYKYTPLSGYTLEDALQKAMQGRSDLQAAAAGVRAAEQGVKAARAERAPQLTVNADFGGAGTTPSQHSTSVYEVYGLLTVPLYEGGRIRGEVAQANAALTQRKAELESLRGQVDEDVRQAFINLNSAADQVTVAQNNVELSHQTLTQARDRFAAGITDTVEVVQAEQAVVQADDDYISAVYEHNLAKVSLARAMGDAEQTLPQMLRK